MKPKHQRLVFIAVSIVFLCAATLFTLEAFKSNLVFFMSPSDIAANPPPENKLVRVGGLVEKNSVKHDGNKINFKITDGVKSLEVSFEGMPPTLFREGQGAIAEGYLRGKDSFEAKRLLTKHDEKYVPKEIVDSLKKTGHWHEGK